MEADHPGVYNVYNITKKSFNYMFEVSWHVCYFLFGIYIYFEGIMANLYLFRNTVFILFLALTTTIFFLNKFYFIWRTSVNLAVDKIV